MCIEGACYVQIWVADMYLAMDVSYDDEALASCDGRDFGRGLALESVYDHGIA
jgi:hypothetical protein